MVQPTSGDDYYAKIETSTTQSDTGTEKKKIKIVAKKVVSQQPEKVQPPTPEPVTEEYDTRQAVLDNNDPPYSPRTTQLPESGTLDLGSKFVSRPAVVFHSHQNRSALSGSQPRSPSSAPGARPSFNRPSGGAPRPG